MVVLTCDTVSSPFLHLAVSSLPGRTGEGASGARVPSSPAPSGGLLAAGGWVLLTKGGWWVWGQGSRHALNASEFGLQGGTHFPVK